MISFESVADSSSVWRWRGTVVITRFSGGRKPMSSIRSASSRTTISIAVRSMVRRSRWSMSRPGVATTMSTPRRSVRTCGMIGSPPTMVMPRRRVPWAKRAQRVRAPASASSRVGTSTRPRGRGPGRAITAAQPLDHRQAERGGLAGAGLGAGEDVAALQGGGNGLGLHGRGRVVAQARERTRECGATAPVRQTALNDTPGTAWSVVCRPRSCTNEREESYAIGWRWTASAPHDQLRSPLPRARWWCGDASGRHARRAALDELFRAHGSRPRRTRTRTYGPDAQSRDTLRLAGEDARAAAARQGQRS